MRCPRAVAVDAALIAVAALLSGDPLLAAPEEVVLRGRAVCLDGAGEPAGTGAECPDHPDGGWALRTGEGTLTPLPRGDERTAMLSDERVRSKELEITAWRDEEGGLAIVHLYTLIDGRLHDPHFYCDVCAIRAHAPGPCWCCRAPFEFREPPVKGDAARNDAPPES